MAKLNIIRSLLKWPTPVAKMQTSFEKIMLQLTGIDITTSPCCQEAKMQLLEKIPIILNRLGKDPIGGFLTIMYASSLQYYTHKALSCQPIREAASHILVLSIIPPT